VIFKQKNVDITIILRKKPSTMKAFIILTLTFFFSISALSQSREAIIQDSIATGQNYFERITFNLAGGVFIPQGQLQRYFGVSPVIEFNFNLPINPKKSIDIVGQFIIPSQTEKFTFIRTIDTVQAKSQFMFNFFAKFNKSLKMTETSQLKAFLGIGVSTISTDARNPFYSGEEGEFKYEFISALLIAPGIDYTFRMSKNSHLLVGINYQYSPYRLEGALRENIGSSAIIPRIQFTF
jgi:hypothetical protein